MINLVNDDCHNLHMSLNDNSIDLIVTDPPYFCGYKNDIYNDSYEQIHTLAPLWFKDWYRILKEDSYLYLFTGVKTLAEWIAYGKESGFNYKNIIATRSFNNGSPTPKNSFGFQFQPIIVFTKGRGKPYNNVDYFPTSKEWFKDKRNTNPKPFTYEYTNFIEGKIGFSTAKRSTKNLHPNEKNTTMIKFLIEISTNENDVVLDSFMGCGSTGISCLHTNRNFIGCELDKNFFNVCEERLNEPLV